jgi:hypothetical protein
VEHARAGGDLERVDPDADGARLSAEELPRGSIAIAMLWYTRAGSASAVVRV